MDNKIFITLGSQKFQFNRLLKAVDELCEKGTVDAEDVFAQIGYSDYLPKNFSYKKFLDRDEFSNEMEKANIVITHGGTGAIIGAVKRGKKVIAVPRLAKYGEHVDLRRVKNLSLMGCSIPKTMMNFLKKWMPCILFPNQRNIILIQKKLFWRESMFCVNHQLL